MGSLVNTHDGDDGQENCLQTAQGSVYVKVTVNKVTTTTRARAEIGPAGV